VNSWSEKNMAYANQRISHGAVREAIKHGLIPKLDGSIFCVDCGNPAKHYDHRDYLKPLEIEAVCQGCNSRRGAAINYGERLIPVPTDATSKSSLLYKALWLIQNTSISIDTISDSTGVTTRWLYKFRANVFTDPGVVKVEKVYNYLSDIRKIVE